MYFKKLSMFYAFLMIILFHSIVFSQSIVTKESSENRFTPPEIGLPDNIPFVKNIIWGENGTFRKLNIGPETRIEELKLRRKMLQAHQWLGIITLAGLAYQYDVGKKLYDGSDSDYWNSHYDKHKAMGYFTYMTYMSTASLSFFSPPARKYDNNRNSIKFHRRMAALHFTAMMAQPFLAKKAVENGKRYNELMDAHLKAGTVAFFALSLDALGITFFK
jgi:hypothetical protein|tara:strand:- start:3296 stop:3949 length:654 start_codon:yes stop_codon:yes gene_type:complete